MALGLGFGCCCKGQCAKLRNCDTLETITTTSDLSAYSVGNVLRRDASEDVGCWELLSLTARCGDSPETFTVDGDPYTGETACADCLADLPECQGCGELQSFFGQPVPVQLWSAVGQPTKMATYLGGGEWEVLYTLDCNGEVEYKFTWQCFEGDWVYSVYRDDVLVLDKQLPSPAGDNTWSTTYEIPEECEYDGAELQSFDLRWTFTPCGEATD